MMRKLMLLGGLRYIIPVIEMAHKMGIYVITCDYLPENVAHKYSDEYCNVSIDDQEAVLEAARKMEIDGIMSFACDLGVVTAAYVAEKLDLPASGPYHSIKILQNKKLFRNFLKENGFKVPFTKSYSSVEKLRCDEEKFVFPVIVKPVDSAGSKGVRRVNGLTELEDSVRYALNFSKSKEVIIEEYIEKRGCSSDSDCFSINGELMFVTFSRQKFDTDAVNPYTPAAYSWPSTFSKKNTEFLTQELQRLLHLLDMGTSIYNVETRESIMGDPYIMEVSPRGGGNRLAEMIEFLTGENLIEASIKAALGDTDICLQQKDCTGFWGEVILHSKVSGLFRGIRISEEISSFVFEKDIWVEEGTEVEAFSGANTSLGTLIIKCDTREQVEDITENVEKYIRVLVE